MDVTWKPEGRGSAISEMLRKRAELLEKMIARIQEKKKEVKEQKENGDDDDEFAEDEEDNVFEQVFFVSLFVLLWFVMVLPPLYDIGLFIYYAAFDFGVGFDDYIADHASGWSIWAIMQFVFSCITLGLYLYILIQLTVELASTPKTQCDDSVIANPIVWFIFMGVNSWSIATASLKMLIIIVELYTEEEDQVTDLFNMKSDAGELAFDIELFPDLGKIGILGLNYVFFELMPLVCEYM